MAFTSFLLPLLALAIATVSADDFYNPGSQFSTFNSNPYGQPPQQQQPQGRILTLISDSRNGDHFELTIREENPSASSLGGIHSLGNPLLNPLSAGILGRTPFGQSSAAAKSLRVKGLYISSGNQGALVGDFFAVLCQFGNIQQDCGLTGPPLTMASAKLGKSPLGPLGRSPFGGSPLGASPFGVSPYGASPFSSPLLGHSPFNRFGAFGQLGGAFGQLGGALGQFGGAPGQLGGNNPSAPIRLSTQVHARQHGIATIDARIDGLAMDDIVGKSIVLTLDPFGQRKTTVCGSIVEDGRPAEAARLTRQQPQLGPFGQQPGNQFGQQFGNDEFGQSSNSPFDNDISLPGQAPFAAQGGGQSVFA